MRGTRGESLNCFGALSYVIPRLCCPLFIHEQVITSTVVYRFVENLLCSHHPPPPPPFNCGFHTTGGARWYARGGFYIWAVVYVGC